MEELSAGGIVIHDQEVLLLKTFQGGWALPKGRMEAGEKLEETAIREVKEETGYLCQIVKYIGFMKYNYYRPNGEWVRKTVHYYAVEVIGGQSRPQHEEGFSDAAFVPWQKAIRLLRYDSERNMVRTVFEGPEKKGGGKSSRYSQGW